MTTDLLNLLRCPVTREPLQLEILSKGMKLYDGQEKEIILTGILRSSDCVYPVIDGVPRLLVEACIDYQDFLARHISNFADVKNTFETKYRGLLNLQVWVRR